MEWGEAGNRCAEWPGVHPIELSPPHPPAEPTGRKVVSHEMVLGGRLAAKTSFSLNRPSSPRVEDLKGELNTVGCPQAESFLSPTTLGLSAEAGLNGALSGLWLLAGAALYSRLREYLLTEEQLKENGYPFPHPDRPGGAVIFTAEEKRPKDRESRQAGNAEDPEGGGPGGQGLGVLRAGLGRAHHATLGLHPSFLQDLLPLWRRVPRVFLRPLHPRRGMQLPLGPAAPEPRSGQGDPDPLPCILYSRGPHQGWGSQGLLPCILRWRGRAHLCRAHWAQGPHCSCLIWTVRPTWAHGLPPAAC